jgi:hypothetical protein
MSDELTAKIKVLNERIWEDRARMPAINAWLSNFTGQSAAVDIERKHALHILAHFMYFGSRETRALLKSLFRDAYRYPIIETIRRTNGDTVDGSLIRSHFASELAATRFLGVGNPAESGTHLLYYFRQENGLPKELFINPHQIFSRTSSGVALRAPNVKRYIFLDDISGSGHQAQEYSQEIVSELKRLAPTAHAAYYVLFATTEALTIIRSNTLFDDVNCVFDLDPSFACFGDSSRYFAQNDSDIDKNIARQMCLHYGGLLWPDHPLGYGDCQLLLGFHHNTPDNTLPIIWYDEPGSPWHAMFKRYPKLSVW